MDIDYEGLENEIIKTISSNKIAVLATSYCDRVTARAMSYVNDGLNISFQTGIDSLKYEQMKKNSKVALCLANIQIEGKANFRQQSLYEKDFIGKYKLSHPGSFKTYSSMKKSYVVEIRPELITLWKYSDDRVFRDFLDVTNRMASRVFYDTSERIL
jgi:hypothetical protein